MPVVLNKAIWFPDPNLADADGLVAVGGDLSVPRLLAAYRQGIFPWTVALFPLMNPITFDTEHFGGTLNSMCT